jgi:transcriptional regulator GlxA family with amidase domain
MNRVVVLTDLWGFCMLAVALLTQHGALLAPSEESVVTDGGITTSRGPATAMEFSLALVGELYGQKKMHDISAQVLFEKN